MTDVDSVPNATSGDPASSGPAFSAAASKVGSAAAPSSGWTCPFCPLHCDGFSVEVVPVNGIDAGAAGKSALRVVGSDCPRANAALSMFDAASAGAAAQAAGSSPTLPPAPTLGGAPCTLAQAVEAAAHTLSNSVQPLFAGLGTDVAGARALYPLACATGAISDAALGDALHQSLGVQQDRGGYATTLSEVRTRADLIVCIGGWPALRYPELFDTLAFAARVGAAPRIIVLGDGSNGGDGTLGASTATSASASAAAPASVSGIAVDVLPLAGDLFDTVATLAALVAGRPLAAAPAPALVDLAASLRAARYAVLVYSAAALPAHGGLVIEAIDRIVATLNRSTRAATLPLGGDHGAATVSQTFSWLSGLPLRSRAGPLGLEHEPRRWRSERLLAEGAVDSLLWIASFGTEPLPPAARVPTVLLGHPRFAVEAAAPGTVFIPVATPGIGTAGHLFRNDGVVLMPLWPVAHRAPEPLPALADVLRQITASVQALQRQMEPAQQSGAAA